MDATLTRIWQMTEPLAASEGMEIVDIELKREGTRGVRILRVYLDKAGGPAMEDLSKVSRSLSDLLDEHEDVIEGSYSLEVSSPGIKRPEHFSRFIGKRVRVRTREPIGGRRVFLGSLLEVTPERIALNQDGTRWEIPFSIIEKSNYEHDWSA
jgi:ribosome maturation factor RimP